ncbi:caspase family protein [Iningainema tapete]|uniref:Caspase family protein n=1 Tax=Iningainema tapete BLCC-T55 TaxID=2748662 RepID=A0A8J6XPL4_9CYAN|nr:caspase family protein [Iningainema tapete]MBD2775810.1 caspase family protein [Iningainema tapete BLCC-T55]
MSPLGVGSSYSTNTLTTGEAKLWILLVGVNEYLDPSLRSLRYPALDCQGLGEALNIATQAFPNKEVIVHNDLAAQPPTLQMVRGSLHRIVSQSQSQDSILLYFSGHGMLDPNTQQAVLCLADTHQDDLVATGLGMQELVRILGASPAYQQLVCLDTCHSGDMRLLRGRGVARDAVAEMPNPTTQMMEVLRQRAAQSKGFCALLSCDQGQQSWEFPELGHGVFTYYLMQGLLGGAADAHGMIEADGLYKYVYRQTLQYINKLNQQLRIVNEQKLNRGDSNLLPEYPLQTPKRIVEGVGELIVGFKSAEAEAHEQRRALIIDGLSNKKTTINLSLLLGGSGGFEVEYFPQKDQNSDLRSTIQGFTRCQGEAETKPATLGTIKNKHTSLLYIRGQIEEIEDGEAWLILGDDMRLSRSWLRQELRRAKTQQIIILDLIISDSSAASIENWIEDLQSDPDRGQCLIVAATRSDEPELFSQIILQTLVAVNPQTGLPVAKWITQLQTLSQAKGINLHTWLSGAQAVIDILPGNISTIVQNFRELKEPKVQENKQESNKQEGKKNLFQNVLSFSTNLSSRPSQKPSPTQLDVNVSVTKQPQNSLLSSEQYANLEQLLKQTIGPIAPKILQKAVMQAANCQELVENLATYLVPQQQKEFSKRATAIVSVHNPLSQSSKGQYQVIDANFISKCERELAYLIGPIANFLITEVLQSHPQISLTEFVNKLAKEIPEPKQALEFERRILDQ